MHCLAKSASVAILAAVSFLSVRANAAQLTGTVLHDGTAVADLDGQIIAGDAKSFDDLLQSATATGHNVVGLRLNSPGGLVGEDCLDRSLSVDQRHRCSGSSWTGVLLRMLSDLCRRTTEVF